MKNKIVKSEMFKTNVNGKYDVFIEDFSLKTDKYQFRMVNTQTGEERIDGIYKSPHYNEVYEELIEDLLTF